MNCNDVNAVKLNAAIQLTLGDLTDEQAVCMLVIAR